MYSIAVSLNAQEEIENIEALYFKISHKISDKFVLNLSHAYTILERNPFFGIRYKNYRAVTIEKFPYLLFYEIDEINKKIYILSCFHASINSEKYPI
ncbi:MAG: hypothetical protein H7174_04310 [Flavobacterium sp.]|nr:hypothetical protein [Flavobacterium sp.]